MKLKSESKLREKKGISLIVLSITVIALIIITGIVVINSEETLANVNVAKLQTDIAQIENLMNTYVIRKNGVLTFDKVLFDTSSLSDRELVQFEGENISNGKVELYVIDLLEIDAESVNFGKLDLGEADRFLYSIETKKVYYEMGLETDDVTYYYVKDGEDVL